MIKHFGVVLKNQLEDGHLIAAALTTLGGAKQLKGTVEPASRPFWVPVTPAVKEFEQGFDPISRRPGSTHTTKHVWVNVRNTLTLFPGNEKDGKVC